MIELYKRRKKKVGLKKIINVILIIFAIWFFGHIVYIVIDGVTDDNKKADVITVLGNKVKEDGSLSVRLKSRLDKAIEVYNKELADEIIVSGGYDEKVGYNEADVMKGYLVSKKIPEQNIIVDKNGDSTYNSAKNVKIIMEERGFNSVIIVSQYFHITRAKFAFRHFGIENVYSACAYLVELHDLYSVPREFIAFYYYLFRQYT